MLDKNKSVGACTVAQKVKLQLAMLTSQITG